MANAFRSIPATAKVQPSPFKISITEEKLAAFTQLVKLSELGPETYECLHEDGKYGLPRKWLAAAKQEWEESFDWRKHEAYYNSFPHFIMPVMQGDDSFSVHFVALFSDNPDALPIMFLHGWPGSFLEFLGLLALLKKRYSPETLPYHIIVPSLPGWAFSSPPPLNRDFKLEDMAEIMNGLMNNLGLSGYVVQGGDIGSYVARVMAAAYHQCRAVHLNYCIMAEPDGIKAKDITEAEQHGVLRAREFTKFGAAYALEHATRPGTIGLALASSPVAYLAWVAEKFLLWSDVNPSTSEILQSVSLYFLTSTISTSIYTYRQATPPPDFFPLPKNSGAIAYKPKSHDWPQWFIDKPMGYSWFPKELAPMPVAWVGKTGKLEWWRRHDKGGHFAALEKPELLLGDVEDFVKQVWKK
ncbi:alpha/beta-hydrolase [Rhizodiscina lignyota]|uniref:Alpha/beta-hydrolase n=1 Tax=Rhizodiscina lignyota TaxID=1504668 RepID=A0A9P4M3I1_9PEZI|nr:alpha/beta-hydrolase [Rhizodiscina lignyota]